jgi:hypothetical protein
MKLNHVFQSLALLGHAGFANAIDLTNASTGVSVAQVCAQVVTCFSGQLYSNACGPSSGSSPIGVCKAPIATINIAFDGTETVTVDQAEFHPGTRGGLSYQFQNLPSPLLGSGLRVTARNNSDDQWVFVSHKVGPEAGVKPNTKYRALLTVRFASNMESGCSGVGGSFESIKIKGGVVNRAPAVFYDPAWNYYRFNIDKGNQGNNPGPEAIEFGNPTTEVPCGTVRPWMIISRSGVMNVTSNAEGNIWAYVGTDSGFEGTHELHYDRLMISLQPD